MCARPRKVFGVPYPKCPERWRIDPAWQAIIAVLNAAEISPLAGWPDAYLGYVVRGVTTLKAVQVEWHRRKLEETRKHDH